MHLSRFITIDICAMTFMLVTLSLRSYLAAGFVPSSVLNLLAAPADDGDLIALVPGGADVVERVGKLGVPTDEVAGFHQHPGQRVVDPPALAGGFGEIGRASCRGR